MKSYKTIFTILFIFALLFSIAATSLDPDKKVLHLGFDGRNWAIPGNDVFQFNCVLRQNGSSAWSDPAGATEGSVFIAYPKSYGSGNTPIVLATIYGSTADITISTVPVWAGFLLYWKSDVPQTYFTFFWMSEGICDRGKP